MKNNFQICFLIYLLFSLNSILCVQYYHLGPKHYCQMCETAMETMSKKLEGDKWKSSAAISEATNTLCNSINLPRPLKEGCLGMIKDHAPTLMRLVGRQGIHDLKKNFCWDALDPPACPPIKEDPISWRKVEHKEL